METNAVKTRKRTCVKSFRLDMQDEFIFAMLEMDGIKDRNHVVEVKGDVMKIGVVQMQDGKVLGVISERFTIPGTKNAQLVSKRVVDGTLSLVIAKKDAKKSAVVWPHISRFKHQNKLMQNAAIQLN